ncbi:MAG: hypothetical protein ACKV2T_39020 [Kofleriaceae bacterium]
MFAAVLANVVVVGLGGPPSPEPTLIRLELAAESAVTNVSSAWLWNPHGHAVLTEGDAHSRGVEGRVLFGNSPVYIGLELGVSQITSAPALHDGLDQGTLYRSTTPPGGMFGASTGTSVTMAAPIGVQARLGPLLVGVEGLIGWRRMSLESVEGGPTVDGFVPLVETRVRAGVWITPTVSLSLLAGKGVVVNDSHSLCAVLSLSKLPFDGER